MNKTKRFTPPASFTADHFTPLSELEGVELEIKGISHMDTRFGKAMIFEALADGKAIFVITSSSRVMAMFSDYKDFPVLATFTKTDNRWMVA